MNIEKADYISILRYGTEKEFYEKMFLEDRKLVDIINQKATESSSLLMAAISGRKFELAKVLLENGIKVNQITQDGYNEFHILAAHLRHPSALVVAELLLEKGVDLAYQDKIFGNTAMFSLCLESLKAINPPEVRDFVCRCLSKNKGIDEKNKRGNNVRTLIETRGTSEMKKAIEYLQ